MDITRTHYEAKGWVVKDTSANRPYDFECTRGDEHLYVEVKGTTSDGRSIVLTKNEVDLHLDEHPGTALANRPRNHTHRAATRQRNRRNTRRRSTVRTPRKRTIGNFLHIHDRVTSIHGGQAYPFCASG